MLLALLALVCLVCGTFFPIAGFDFVNLDVYTQIAHYPHIRGVTWENVRQIFTSRHVTSYYPVRTLTFAVDHQVWGLHPGGFKLTNGLIHLANVLLVFWLILRLFRNPAAAATSPRAWWDASAAAFAAGIFAVHPLVVEPVTWVSGREELLMTLGTLASIHFHLAARGLQRRGAGRASRLACHAGTIVCCAAACLSNAVAAVIPLLITAWDLLMLKRPTKARRIFYPTAPLWAMAMAAIVIKKLGGGHHAEPLASAFSPEWLMVIFKLYWRNLKAIFWPNDLALTYEWIRPTSFLDVEVMLGAAAVALSCLALWTLRRRPLALFGLLWFGIALGPTSQIMPHYVARADRFLYLPLVGLAIAAGAGARPLGRVLNRRATIAAALLIAASGPLLVGLLGGRQVQTWRSETAVWENCLRVSPNNHLAHRCLADELAQLGQLDQAIAHYKSALWLDFENETALSNFARVLVTCDRDRRDYDLALELAEFACEVSRGDNPEIPRTLAMVHNNHAVDLSVDGHYDRAIDGYRRAIETDPQYAAPLFNLALLLATCDDEILRRPAEAVGLARRACEIVGLPDANQLMILAVAHAQAGSPDAAIRTMEKAVSVAESAGDSEQAILLRGRLQLYRDQDPHHHSRD